MSEYICVEDFLKYIDDTICKGCREDGKDANGIVCRACQIMDMLGYVEDFPAADVEPVIHAKWIYVDMPFNNVYVCSNCRAIDSDCSDGLSTHRVMLQERCPQCGAKMDKR